jgi:hypothetical protein
VRSLLAVALVTAVASGAAAQGDAATRSGTLPPVAPVLRRIPAGSIGYVVVKDFKATMDRADRFLADVGLGEMVKATMPNGLADFLIKSLALGEGFLPHGGLALVVMDPKTVDLDPADLATKLAAGRRPEFKAPIVVLVPAKGVREVFGNYELKQEGRFWHVRLPVGPMVAAPAGGDYVALSPAAGALSALLDARKHVPGELARHHADLIARSHLAVHVNMDVTGPIAEKVLNALDKHFEQEMRDSFYATGAVMMRKVLSMYHRMLGEVGPTTIGLQLAGDGVVLDEWIDWRPQGTVAKALRSAGPPKKAALNRLPDLPYVLACGDGGDPSQREMVKMVASFYVDLLASLSGRSGSGRQVPKASLDKLKKAGADLASHIRTSQFVVGGSPAGMFGICVVLNVDSGEKFTTGLAEAAKAGEEILNHMAPQRRQEQRKMFRISYVKGVETVGDLSVDALNVDFAELSSMPPRGREEMRKVLGEDKIRVLIASHGKNTVVMTFGGSLPMMAEAVKVAGGKGTIGSGELVAQAMKHMPKNPSTLTLLNGGNLFEVITKAMRSVEPEARLPFQVQCKIPIVAASAVEGTGSRSVVYVPNRLIEEVASVCLQMLSGLRPAPAGPPPAGEMEQDL